ncbi:bifunctional [glutamine synthetase] adenylyltransferase/[glutamine synthetase]-adenylyl-L-tyrosine phosphorylase [soil metagenome]
MTDGRPLIDDIAPLPAPWDTGAAERAVRDLQQAGDPQAVAILESPRARPLLEAVFGASPFLRDMILRDPAAAASILNADPEHALTRFCERLAEDARAAKTEDGIKRVLRRARGQAALLIALADLSGVWNVDRVTGALTRFAESVLQAAVNWLLCDGARSGRVVVADTDHPARNCGYTILAMGKFGASELNYSSDIDLIVLYDPQAAPLAGVEPSIFFVRQTKRLVKLLQDVTEDGYAFRVDLRLRPDPRATQIAISIEAAAIYYESMGQNWERAAMIKARAAAGDIALGEEFLQRLTPYIWRKYLDFAAIADVQSLKRQIHAVKGHGTIAVRGHNIKLGRGGIREIEFFVQTQQLIAGGRNPALRGRRTLDMLDALAAAGWISSEAARELSDAYRFLRTIEHRIQMIADEQTHDLPESDEAFDGLARFSGFASGSEFETVLRTTFETVQRHYAALFKDAEELGTDSGSLVFTGGEDDPETLATLAGMGFKQPSEISAAIRGWHFGRFAATRSARARERLTELMPELLSALARSGDADQAFLAFDKFLAGLPAGVQLFSLLRSNPNLLDLLATILGTAPKLAHELSRRPKVLDAVLDPGFFGPRPGVEEIERLFDSAMPPGTPLDEVVDRARIVAKEQMFRIGVRILSETVGAEETGAAFSDLAQIVLSKLHPAVGDELAARHGVIAGGRSAIVALGKLGGREMTAGSDLDLILVYDAPSGTDMSDGKKPLPLSQYYSRLTQRLIAALTAPTAEGILYEVDMRLRPSGSMGPVATSLAAFTAYHHDQAWTWERLALTRARVVAGDPALAEAIETVIRDALCAPRDPAVIAADVGDMRRLMLKENPAENIWDLKRIHGGQTDVDFIVQYLQLAHGVQNPMILDPNIRHCIAKLAEAGILPADAARHLTAACRLYQRLTQVLRLCAGDTFDPVTSPPGLNRLVAGAAETPDIAAAESLIVDAQAGIIRHFAILIGRL